MPVVDLPALTTTTDPVTPVPDEGESIRERVEAAQGLLNQAVSALDRHDYQGAANLAYKARLLAESLASAGS